MFTAEIQKNLDTFESMKDELEKENVGRTALLHGGELVSIYNDNHDAFSIGCDRFGIGNFVIKKIGESPISLGIHTLNLPQQSNTIHI